MSVAAAPGQGSGAARQSVAVFAVPLLGVMAGVQTADPTIASTALVESSRALGMDAGVQAIAASISTLMLAATVISTGLLADRIGRKLLLMLALVASIVGGLIAAVAFDPISYMLGRAIAGIGLGAVFAASFAYLRAVVPAPRLPAAMGSFAAYSALTVIGASFLGGALADVDWRLAFLVTPVLAGLSVVAVVFVLPGEPRSGSGPADIGGQILLILGIIGVLYGISHAGRGLTQPLTWIPFVVGLVLLAAFVLVEARVRHPFFPIEIFANPGFLAAVAIGLAFNISQAVAILQTANIWQFVYGFQTIEVSLAQLPMTVVSVIASVLLGRWLTRGLSVPMAIILTGTATTLGFLSLALTLLSGSFWAFLPALVLIGFGISGLVPYGALIIRLAPPEHFGVVTSSRTTIGQFGYALGLSGGVILVNALAGDDFSRRLAEAGVPPTRLGQALDAVQQYTQSGTTPSSAEGGTALLAGAAEAYRDGFVATAIIVAIVIAVLSAAAVILYRRWDRMQAATQSGAASASGA